MERAIQVVTEERQSHTITSWSQFLHGIYWTWFWAWSVFVTCNIRKCGAFENILSTVRDTVFPGVTFHSTWNLPETCNEFLLSPLEAAGQSWRAAVKLNWKSWQTTENVWWRSIFFFLIYCESCGSTITTVCHAVCGVQSTQHWRRNDFASKVKEAQY